MEQPATGLRAAVFPGYADELNALGVETIVVRASTEQRELAPQVDIVLTAPDNLYAWAADGQPPLHLIAGGEVRGLGLYRGPSDGPLVVDAPNSGFAFLARALDGPGRPLLEVGATPQRQQALLSGLGGTDPAPPVHGRERPSSHRQRRHRA